jgi:urocanate hydratase
MLNHDLQEALEGKAYFSEGVESVSLAQFMPGTSAGRSEGVLIKKLIDSDAIRDMQKTEYDDAADTLKQTLEEAVTAENKSLREKQGAAYNKSSNGATFFSSLFN